MRRFFVGVLVITALLHIPFGIGLEFGLRRAGVAHSIAIAMPVALTLAALVLGRMRSAGYDRPRSVWRMRLVEEPYFIHWCATFVGMAGFLLGSLAMGLRSLLGGADAWYSEPGAIAALSYGAGLLLAFWGVVIRRRWVRVRSIEVPIAGLGRAFDGYRIAQLSDLHIGSLCPRKRAERWVERANALGPDLVALTGDYVTSGVAFHGVIAGVLGGLRAKDGVIAVMGNHDYFGDGEPLITLLRQAGITVLRNERTELERAGARLTVGGVDDTWTRRASVARTLDGFAGEDPLIVLAHDPALFPALARGGADLVLSGHTHWGQVAVPFFAARFNLSRLKMKHHADLYREGASALYVNPGLGTTGPPVRMGAAPEITLLTLRAI